MEPIGEWKKLQNGSDIRGVATYTKGGEPVNLTYDKVKYITRAFLKWLSEKKAKSEQDLTIGVGTDSRISGPELKSAVIEASSSVCAKSYDCSIASTPAMFMSCVLPESNFDGGIMITASHLPFNRNGMKFFTRAGGLDSGDITTILSIAQCIEKCEDLSTEKKDCEKGETHTFDLISVYSKDLVSKIRMKTGVSADKGKPLEGMKIIVDAGNGAGGFFARKVLEPLGADTSGSLFLDPDGMFPNHVPNPEDSKAVESIKKAVEENSADFGIIFDTDVDRAGAVDRKGREINRNRLVALMATIVLEEHPGTTVVTDSITSSELSEYIEKNLGGKHHRFKRGYKNVINEAVRLNSVGEETHLAIETSGHGALKENFFLDDGAYMISKMLVKISQLKKQNKTIDSLIEDFKEPLESDEFRFKITCDDFKRYGKKIIGELNRYSDSKDEFLVEPNNYEGIRVSFDKNNGNGWFLLRMSLHDPVMPLNIESNDSGGVKKIAEKLSEFLDTCENLDISPLKDYIGK